jgi:hypothetical protein
MGQLYFVCMPRYKFLLQLLFIGTAGVERIDISTEVAFSLGPEGIFINAGCQIIQFHFSTISNVNAIDLD